MVLNGVGGVDIVFLSLFLSFVYPSFGGSASTREVMIMTHKHTYYRRAKRESYYFSSFFFFFFVCIISYVR